MMVYNLISVHVSPNSGIAVLKHDKSKVVLIPDSFSSVICPCIFYIGITNRVNSATDTLKRVRAGMIAKRKRDAISSIRSDLASAFGRKRGVGSKLYSNHLQEGQTGSMEA